MVCGNKKDPKKDGQKTPGSNTRSSSTSKAPVATPVPKVNQKPFYQADFPSAPVRTDLVQIPSGQTVKNRFVAIDKQSLFLFDESEKPDQTFEPLKLTFVLKQSDVFANGLQLSLKEGSGKSLVFNCRSEEHKNEWITALEGLCRSSPPAPVKVE